MINNLKSVWANIVTSRKICVSIMAVLAAAAVTLVSLSMNTVTINDGSSSQTLYTLKSETADVLALATLNSENYNIKDVKRGDRNISIALDYTVPVHITMGDETLTVFVPKGETVQSAIALAGIQLDKHDSINIPLLNTISDTEYINIIDIEYVTETLDESIPYTTKTVYSSKSNKTVTTTAGQNGTKRVTYLKKVVNGVASGRELVSEEVITKPVTQVVTVGIKNGTTSSNVESISTLTPSSPIELDSNGNPVNYKKKVTVQATAYTYTGNNCASGVAPQPGYVAVNTNIFPFGTKFYIKSSDGKYIYGYAVAADTGGFLATRPTNFDLFFETEAQCRAFGRRNIEVYVLY